MLDVERVARYIERGTIEIAPIAFMRGRTLNDSFVILDEAQNTTSEQMKMFLTRLGFGSKAVITGRHHADRPADRPDLGADRGDEGRQRDRGHLVRLLRRARRRPAQAGAADRQGVRSVLERQRREAARPSIDHASRGSTTASRRGCGCRLRSDESGRPVSDGGLRAWLERRGAGRALVARSTSRSSATRACGAESDVSPQELGDRRLELSDRRAEDGWQAPRVSRLVPGRHRDRARRRAARAQAARPSAGTRELDSELRVLGRSTVRCTSRLRSRARQTAGCVGSRRVASMRALPAGRERLRRERRERGMEPRGLIDDPARRSSCSPARRCTSAPSRPPSAR